MLAGILHACAPSPCATAVTFRSPAVGTNDASGASAVTKGPSTNGSGIRRWLRSAVAGGTLVRVAPEAVAAGLLGALEARCFTRYLGGAAYAPGDDARFVEDLVGGLVPLRRGSR